MSDKETPVQTPRSHTRRTKTEQLALPGLSVPIPEGEEELKHFESIPTDQRHSPPDTEDTVRESSESDEYTEIQRKLIAGEIRETPINSIGLLSPRSSKGEQSLQKTNRREPANIDLRETTGRRHSTFKVKKPASVWNIPQRKKQTARSESKSKRDFLPDFLESQIQGEPESSPEDGQEFELPVTENMDSFTNFKIPVFSGAKDEDLETFLDFIDYGFMPMVNKFPTETERNKVKAYLLMSNTSDSAQAWIQKQKSDTRRSFIELTKAMRIRFPEIQHDELEHDPYDDLMKLHQKGRRLMDYFEAARDLERRLPDVMIPQLCKMVVKGLDDINTRRVVGGILGKNSNRGLEETLRAVEGASIDDHSDDEEARIEKAKAQQFAGLKGSEKTMAKLIHEQSQSYAQTMKLLSEGLAGLRINQTQPGTMSTSRNGQRTQGAQGNGYSSNKYPSGGTTGGQRNGPAPTCFNCGREGHRLEFCPDAPASNDQRNRYREEYNRKRESAGLPRIGNPSSNFQTTGPMDRYTQRPQGQVAANVSTQIENDEDSRSQENVMNQNGQDWPEERQALDSWDSGDQEMYLRSGTNTVDVAEERQLAYEVYEAQKRKAAEAALDSDSSPTTTVGDSQAARPKPRTKRPPRKPKAMGDQVPFDIGKCLRDTMVPITLAQLLNAAPSLRSQFASNIRLEPLPKSQVQQGKQPAQANREVAPVPAAAAKRRRANQVEIQSSNYAQAELDRRLETVEKNLPMDPHRCFTKADSPFHPNFYTTSKIQAFPNDPKEHTILKTLVDGGSSMNLISRKIVDSLGMKVFPDISVSMRVADGKWTRLPGYVRIRVMIAGSARVVQLGVVDGDTSYSILLGRPWMRAVKAIGYYESDNYYIVDEDNNRQKVQPSNEGQKMPKPITPEFVLTSDLSDLPMNEQDRLDLLLSSEGRIDNELLLAIQEAEEQEAEDEEYYDQTADSDNEDEDAPLKVFHL